MYRIAALTAVAAVIFAPAASAGVTCSTDAAAAIAAAAVNGPRAGWDPPVWTFDMPTYNMSVDVQAYDQPTAASKAQAWLQGQVDAACAAENPAPPSAPNGGDTSAPTTQPAPTVDQTAAAQALVDAAPVTYVGNSWGPIPLWRVDLPSLSLSIDVAANSADEARTAVVGMVADRLAAANPQTVTTTQATTTTTAPTVDATPAPAPTVAPVTAPGVTTVPIEVARLLTPTLDPGIRAMLLATTG